MGGANVNVLLLLLVCVFAAAVDSQSIKCDDVTGHVGDKINLTCRVSYQSDTCCMMVYKFMNKDKDTTVCREEFTRDPCVNLTSISCPYTANEVTTATFKVFIQTTCGLRTKEFTVNITEPPISQLFSEVDPQSGYNFNIALSTEDTPWMKDNQSLVTVLVLAVTGLVICLVIVVAVGLILRKYNCINILQRGYDERKLEENNIHEPINTEEV